MDQYDQCPGKILGIIMAGSQVPSTAHVSESQRGGKFPTCEPQVTTKLCLNIIKIWFFILLCTIIRVTWVKR